MQGVISKIKNLVKIRSHIESLHQKSLYDHRVSMLNYALLNDQSMGTSEEKYCDVDFIVSLTTYSKRLYDVYLTIESIMQQSRKANRIILWLENELESKNLPMALKLQQKRGLEIYYCTDIKSYKKLIPSLKLFPDNPIITIDDDVIYDVDMIDKLILGYLDNPKYIYYNRGHKMKLLKPNLLDRYLNWGWCSKSLDSSLMNFPTGVGGVLYPPNCFDDEVFNQDVFLDICKTADDVWFKAMSILRGTQAKKVYTRNPNGEEYLENYQVQDIGLNNLNNTENQNDIQIKKVFDKYNLYQTLID